MNYTIEEIQGIGPTYGKQLAQAGITTTEELLEKCGNAAGRKAVASSTGLTESQILSFANMADLMRVNGVGKQFAELLHAAGVDTVKELATRNPENVATSIETVNAERNLAKTVPTPTHIADWVAAAKELAPVITH